MQTFSQSFARSFSIRLSPIGFNIPERKILDKYQTGKLCRVRANKLAEERKQVEKNRELARAIVSKTKAYKEWEFETKKMKEDTYKRYIDTIDEVHPFLVDDYRMEVAREKRRIDAFYKPLIERESDILYKKRQLGLIHIEPEPFYLEGLDDIIPKIHELLNSEPEDTSQIQSKHKKEKKLIE